MQDDNLFASEMGDVTPLKRDPRERLIKTETVDASRRRQAATQMTARSDNFLSDDGVPPLDAWYVLDFKRPGIQNGVYRKLRLGQYETEARLDLHRYTVAEARRELWSFFKEARRLGLRTLLITHGKGFGNKEKSGSGVLKGYVNRWLQDIDDVQAFHSAQPQHGGTGSVYVLLRKSDAKKKENRELYTKGRQQDV
ncbi:MAG: DNA endonuclease SmrA [Alteromonadaceae bacterium]|nr:DNA endonuclease SmrA [Alteromonadaceae bacterium]MBL6901858.1 DNA endonuclease SmrA [Luminiphilus sp.]RCL46400.1 MAG: DNA endonuclease SmrA [Halieaceae bacterium]RPH09176.1 MAG: DNA endonuclease SmrA [Alteromonadaceae bacterium TMED101]CAI8424203.1 MAG: putative DNA endonuclease SmrA [Halieaceae bacterium]